MYLKREKKHDDIPTDNENMPASYAHQIGEKCNVKISELKKRKRIYERM